MLKRICLVLGVLLLPTVSYAQTPQLEEVRAGAEECSNALISGDYGKFVELTYPKLVELMGGRSKMISGLVKEMGQMKAGGFEIISASVKPPEKITKIGAQSFALVPYLLKMKAPRGVLTQQSYMLGITGGGKPGWTYVDVTNMDEAKLKVLLPELVGKMTFPKKQPPVFEPSP